MPADLRPFQQAILRISDEEGTFHGVGCLVNPTQAITCAHVVADALGYARDIDSIPDGKVQINCPFNENNPRSVTAQVKAWLPLGQHQLSDMALLQLDDPLSEQVSIKLSYSVNLKGVRFKAWGGPAGHALHLIDIEGIVADSIGNGRYRLDVKDSNYKIEKGCSGAPVVDIETGRVLGLIAQEELDENIPAGFLIPVAHWRQTGWFPEPHAGAALEPLKAWVKNHYTGRLRERQRIERFVAHYAGTREEPMPFAGRSECLERLDEWFAQDHHPCLLLSGSAGRGKSALLLHWLARFLHHSPTVVLIFFPISIRFETSNELEGLRLLHAVLCDYFDDLRFSSHDKPDTHDYRDRLFNAWEQIANRPTQRYLLAIDGIDESANHWFLKEILPMNLPANLHLLLSARHRPGETDGTNWLQALYTRGEVLELPPLVQSAIAEAIIQLGRPLDALAEREAFVAQLYRLTDQGDPLLLTLWIGQLWQHRKDTPYLTADQLQSLKPSFAGFYNIWLKEQQQLWQEQAIDIHPSDFDQRMQVLASAQGPLLLEELVDVLARIQWPVPWDYVTLRKVLTTAHRLVVGEGEHQGFSLIHPRLNDYFQAELAKHPARQRQVKEAYLNWGAEVVARLNQTQLTPNSCCPAYLLHHYTEHLVAAHLEPRLALEAYWLPLLEGGWHPAWEAHEDGAWDGFLSDLQQVMEVLHQYNQMCDKRGDRKAMKLAMEVRCALIRVSIHTLAQNIPSELVVELVRANIWPLTKAERVAAQFEAKKQVDCLIGLAEVVLPKDKDRLLQQALTTAEKIQDNRARANTSIALAPLLSGELHQQILQQALTTAEKIQDEKDRAKTLVALAPLLSGEHHQHLLQQALTTAEKIQYEWDRAEILIALAPLLSGERHQHLLQQALATAEKIQDEEARAKTLIALAPLLNGDLHQHLLQQALTTAEKIQNEWVRIEALAQLAPLLEDELRQQVLQQALTAVENIQNKWVHVQALSQLAPLLGDKQRQQALQQALTAVENFQDGEPVWFLNNFAHLSGDKRLRQILRQTLITVPYEWYRAWVSINLAPLLEDEPRQQILQQALTDVGNIQDEKYRVQALTQLAPLLEPHQQLLQKTLTVVRKIQDERDCTQVLIKLASLLEENEVHQQVLQQALAATRKIQDEKSHAHALINLALLLEDKPRQQVLKRALTTAKNIQDKKDRAQTLIQLAPLLEDEPRQQILQEGLTAVGNTQNKWRAYVLIDLAPLSEGNLRQQVLQQTLTAVGDIQDEMGRAQVLIQLVPMLEDEPRQQALQQVLTAAGNIQEEWHRVKVLTQLAPLLEDKPRQQVLQQALAAARKIRYESARARALTQLVPLLKDEPRQQVLQQALTVAGKIQDERDRAQALTQLVPLLEDEIRQQVLQQALTTVGNIQEEYRVDALTQLAPFLLEKTDLQKNFLKIALALSDRKNRIAISATLIQNNPNLLTYDLWSDWLDHAPLKRSELFEVTDKLCDAAIKLTGNHEEANEIARAVMDVGRWWP